MYFFTPDTIAQANKKIEDIDPKMGGLLCILHCLTENIEENISYTIDGEKLRRQLSLVFDKEPRYSYENAKASYIIFAKDWATTFFDNYIKNRVDLLSCAVFFLRRQGFEKEYTKEEVIDAFIKRFNLSSLKDSWFNSNSNLNLEYNQNAVEDNQVEFYFKMDYTTSFKSILFRNVIQKSAADLKAAGQIQTLYSGSGIHTCFLLSDEPLDQYYIMRNSTKKADIQGDIGTESNEEAFKKWFVRQLKENGELYSDNTINQYVGALKAIPSVFAEAIGPFESIFEINTVDVFERACDAIKHAETYDEFNKSRGNGSLSAGLDLYCKFLQEKNSGSVKYLSPEWFKQTAASYSNVDEYANALYQKFQKQFSPEKLRALTDDEILGYIFLGVSDHSLCNALEFDSQYRMFGSIAGGVAYKYGLFYSNNEKTWKTSIGEGGQRSVSAEEALKIGKSIRDALVTGAEIIAKYESISTISEYHALFDELNSVISQHITKMWFLKYYHMIFPSVLPNYYNESWQKHILCNLNIVPSDSQFIRMGQISAFITSCDISCMVFSKIMDDYVGSPKSFYRIGTGDNSSYFNRWKANNYVAIGWNELGDLTSAYQDNADNKAIITDALKSIWNYDNRLSSRKYGEINSFYSASADNSYVVAMSGHKVLGIGVLTGSYFFDEDKEYAHCRPVRWLKVFNEGKTLPIESEGKLTTFYELKNSENLCYLYSLLNGEETSCAIGNDEENTDVQPIKFITNISINQPRNRILFGAPGTGKSYTLNQEKDVLLANGGEYERVTFHPDYSYANFVGTYKPVPSTDNNGNDVITYEYVPGPFMRTYVKALKNSRTDNPLPYLLVIEEINRANVAGVFGDVFQLLDRDDSEVSEYAIQASEDIKKYLSKELGGEPSEYSEIRIPNNMFIWATMNSADQGVFPMDTAFKRRWDFTYLGIDDGQSGIAGKKVVLGKGEHRRLVEWNELRKAINEELLTYKVNEDKLMGPYFIAKKALPDGETIEPQSFTRIFKNKVIMYLFDDAAKQKRVTLFGGCADKDKNQYSKICTAFDTLGVDIFCDAISSKFIDKTPESDAE